MRAWLGLSFFVLGGFAFGQTVSEGGAAARDLTVRLFDTEQVEALTVTPVGGGVTWKRCLRCSPEALKGALPIRFEPGKTLQEVEISGEVRVETSTGHRAAAAGVWRIDSEQDGLRVRVTLPSERYVAAVLTAEAGPDDPPEALRALAITVRSYALDRTARGEELCDSTRCQAMRLGAVSAAVEDAVLDTSGETLWFQGRRVPGYFTQNNGGVAEDAAAAWGGTARPWLRSHADGFSERSPSAWHAEVGGDELRNALAAEGFGLRSPVVSVEVVRRTLSGRAARVEVRGAGSERVEVAAGTFRFAVNRSLGWNRLRSDLYTVQMGPGVRAIFEGKGFGHGVGLSQAGARGMASEGRNERQILGFYFPGAQVRIDGSDDGWMRREGSGWTLLSMGGEASEQMIRTGDDAWRKALALFPPGGSGKGTPHPVVRVFPSTELYSGVTGEPGWTLAATRGDRIFLQPAATIARSGTSASNILLHEMMHVLVERECGAATPLWLREGLVEALAEPGPREASLPSAEIERRLRRPFSLRESQVAHRQAATVLRRLIAVYGLQTVRGWLVTGVPAEAMARVELR